jgi:hypothetical protein
MQQQDIGDLIGARFVREGGEETGSGGVETYMTVTA